MPDSNDTPKTNRCQPVHIIFHDAIVEEVYAPRLRDILQSNPTINDANGLAKSFNKEYGCAVASSTMKEWMEHLGLAPITTTNWNLQPSSPVLSP